MINRPASAASWCPTDTAGFSAPQDHQASCRCGPRSPPSWSWTTSGCPADAVLPEVTGLKRPLSCLNEARFGIVFGALGAARDCLETAIDYAATREVFDRPLRSFQLTQAKLADMTLELQKGFLLALHLGRLKDDHRAASRGRSAWASSTTSARPWPSPGSAGPSWAPTASPWSTR